MFRKVWECNVRARIRKNVSKFQILEKSIQKTWKISPNKPKVQKPCQHPQNTPNKSQNIPNKSKTLKRLKHSKKSETFPKKHNIAKQSLHSNKSQTFQNIPKRSKNHKIPSNIPKTHKQVERSFSKTPVTFWNFCYVLDDIKVSGLIWNDLACCGTIWNALEV